MLQQYLEVGKVTRAHGIMGEVQVQPWADTPEFICQFKTLYVDKTHWPIQVERARVHKSMAILKFHGITDVPGALSMRNAILYIDRADAPLPEGSFFLADLYGLEGRRVPLNALPCAAMMKMRPTGQQCHGCPFVYMQEGALEQLLRSMRVKEEAIGNIVAFAKEGKVEVGRERERVRGRWRAGSISWRRIRGIRTREWARRREMRDRLR